ncbi:integrase [Methylococcus geothermalis]|uniref:Integrase n=1 Tax=Methylococcus geothermalis TaxID=2681310 RepID=A0A858QBI0_9GAMM|nr:integrase [Methylococcus geothermalis]
MRAFVAGIEAVSFQRTDRESAYAWMTDVLARFRYRSCSRADKGVLRRYLAKVTGLSRAQVARCIRQFLASGRIEDRRGAPAVPFVRRYTDEDVRLLAEMDALHGTLSGTTTRKLCERAYRVHGDVRFVRLAGISNGHLYNLRRHKTYEARRGVFDKSRPVKVAIGERRRPHPAGQPGFVRVDSVHQGDWDGIKGVYLINAVDEVTQFQAVFAVEHISEAYLLPVLSAMMDAFPFVIRGFHSDNGAEFINHKVAALLEMRHEQTKSRSRKTTDNALVESKNASTVRKYLGYSHIPQHCASLVNAFTVEVLSPYLNFHRPCHFPTEYVDKKGRMRKRYRYEDMMTPYEKLRSLPEVQRFLKPGLTLEKLETIAFACSDNEAAQHLNQARATLFQTISQSQPRAA